MPLRGRPSLRLTGSFGFAQGRLTTTPVPTRAGLHMSPGANNLLFRSAPPRTNASGATLSSMGRILIIAFGNPLRCDDGLAWRAADELEKRFCGSDVEILRTHQLAPELAESVSGFETVIFVDAASADGTNSQPGEVRSAAVTASDETPRFSHQLSPGAVLALAAQLFGAAPRAFSVTLTGECFDHGEFLSPTIEAAIPALVARVEELVRSAVATQFLPADSCKS